MSVLRRLALYARLVRFSHTIFALPFAVMGAVLAAGGLPDLRTCFLILLAMVGARSAAMSINRLADHAIDAENPRTRGRELPAGRLGRLEVWLFLGVSVAAFLAACALLNRLTLWLSPIPLAVFLTYPYAKRFTNLCHLWLGLALGLSPVGAWVAVRGALGDGFAAAALLGGAVVLWAAGFDVIYALLDEEFDRRKGLFSLPVRFGAGPALAISVAFHVGAAALLVLAGVAAGLGWPYFAGVAAVAALLAYEHAIVRPSDLSRVNTAFFLVNGAVSLVLMAMLIVDVMAGGGPP